MVFKFLFVFALFGTCATAIWKGHSSERLTAAALLLCAIASPVLQTSQFMQPETGILIVDLMLLGYLIVLALRSDRFWPLWAAGFQIVGTLIHVGRLADTSVWQSAYATANVFWSYPVLLALAVGTWLEARYRQW